MLESLKSKLVALFYRVWALPIRFGVLSLAVMLLLCLLGSGFLCFVWCVFCGWLWYMSSTEMLPGTPFMDFHSNRTWYMLAFCVGFFTLFIL